MKEPKLYLTGTKTMSDLEGTHQRPCNKEAIKESFLKGRGLELTFEVYHCGLFKNALLIEV